ncbi:MAG: hypothetical protein ACI4LX_12410 [Treponema sp.]
MKKVIGAVLSLFLMAGAAFADLYSGDFQLHLGAGIDAATVKKDSSASSELNAVAVDFDLSTCHLFGFNDVFSLGFIVDFGFGVGGVTKIANIDNGETKSVPSGNLSMAFHLNGLIGPAVGFKLGKVVKFDIGAGLAYGFSMMAAEYDTNDDGTKESSVLFFGGLGFGTEVQVKFFPESHVSPIIGYRFILIPSKSYVDLQNQVEVKCDSVNYINNRFYLGISFNW